MYFFLPAGQLEILQLAKDPLAGVASERVYKFPPLLWAISLSDIVTNAEVVP